MSGWSLAKRSLFGSGKDNAGASKEWELRPGGMVVQMRDPSADAAHAGPVIKLKVSYGRMYHHISITANSTFGDLKKLLVQDSGLQPTQQRLLYKGKERSDRDCLQDAGVKDKSKIVLVEDTHGWEKRLIELRKTEATNKASRAVSDVQQVVDKLSGQIANVEVTVDQGKRLPDTDLTGLIDLLMCQLVKLDASKVDGEANVKKRILVRRVQKYVETLDALVLKNKALKVRTDVVKGRPVTVNGHHGMLIKTQNNVQSSKAHNDILLMPQNNIQSPNVNRSMVDSNFTPHITKSLPSPTVEPLLIQWD